MGERLKRQLAEAFSFYRVGRGVNRNSQILLTEESGYLEPEDGEKTYQVTQEQLRAAVPHYNSSLMYSLALSFGPYRVDYTKNGSGLLLAGSKGHIALLNWRDATLRTEFHVKELIRDCTFLHNEHLFAVAQRKAVFIYDSQGIEIHCLKGHTEPQLLEYLPYHFLLVSVNHRGFLKYHDVSTGKPAAEHRFHFEHVNCMQQDPWNAVICVGDARGIVSKWTPNVNKPVARLVCHNGPCRAVAVDVKGNYLVTAGADNKMKIYDNRALGEPLYDYWTAAPGSSMSISQTGLLSVSILNEVVVWKDWTVSKQSAPYMTHSCPGTVSDIDFVPFEDFLGIGTTAGFENMSVPGSGIANYDSAEANPFPSKKQRQEKEVKALLDKLPASSIVVDPGLINTVDRASGDVIRAEAKADKEAKQPKMKKKAKGEAKERKRKELKFEETRDKAQANEQVVKDMKFLENLELDALPKKRAKE